MAVSLYPIMTEKTQANPVTIKPGMTYADAGVDIAAGNELVNQIKPLVARTRRQGVLGSIGGFGGLFELRDKLGRSVRRAARIRRAPSRAKDQAQASPMPALAPVIMTVRDFNISSS